MTFSIPFFLILAPAVAYGGDFLLKAHDTLGALSRQDSRLAQEAAGFVADLQSMTAANAQLEVLRGLCLASILSGTAASLGAQGQTLRLLQEAARVRIETRAWKIRASERATVRMPSFDRAAADACGIPGLLSWTNSPGVFLSARARRAGFEVRSEGKLGASSWNYTHPEVLPL
jgi:hypothetical protein